MATKKIAITASVKDEASGPMLKISQSARQAAIEQAATEAKLTEFVKDRQAALEKFLPPAKKVTLEMQKQVAGADPLLKRLAGLQHERTLLTSALGAQAKQGKKLSEEELAMAASAQKSIALVKKEIQARNKLTTATNRGGSQFSKFVQSVQANNAQMAKTQAITANLGRETGRLPEKFGKAAAALHLFSGASSQNSSAVADATGKLADIAALVVTGGPFGIAIAAATGAVALASKGWDEYTREAREAEEAAKKMKEALKGIGEQVEANRKLAGEITASTEAGGDAMELFFFKTEARIAGHQAVISDAMAERAKLWATERRDLQAAAAGEEKLNKIAQNRFDLLGDSIKQHEAAITALNLVTDAKVAEAQATHDQTIADNKSSDAKEKSDAREKKRKEKQAADDTAAKKRVAEEQWMQDEIARLRKEGRDEEKRQRDKVIADEQWAQNWILQLRKEGIDAAKKQRLDAQAEENAMQAERMATGMLVADTLTSATTEMFADMADGSKTAGEAFEGMTQSILQAAAQETMRILTLKAVEAAVSAYAGNVGVPVVGPILAAAAATAAFGAVTAWGANMAEGGVVTGGIEGKDSVRINAMPGEEVIKTRTARDFKREHGQTIGQALEGGSIGGGVTNIFPQPAGPSFVFSSVVPADNRQRRHIASMVNRELMQARARGAAI